MCLLKQNLFRGGFKDKCDKEFTGGKMWWSGKISGKYQSEVRHLSHAYISLIMGLFEVLIANMMLICGTNNIKINII